MSRWQDQFKEHPFQKPWGEILHLIKELEADNQAVTSDVLEIARFKKVVSFITEILESSDIELIPPSTWDNFNQQCSPCYTQVAEYESNRNIQHIKQANTHVDNLLTYIRPYLLTTVNGAKAASNAFLSYSDTINKHLEVFIGHSQESLNKAISINNQADQYLGGVKKSSEMIEELRQKYFDGTDETKSISSKVDGLLAAIDDLKSNIGEYHDQLLGDSIEDKNSIKFKVRNSVDLIEKDEDRINKLLSDVEYYVKDLNEFHSKIFGFVNDEGEEDSGLKGEIESRLLNIDALEKGADKKITALVETVEGLIPGATSVGLATAYKDMKDSFDKPIKNYNILFFISIIFMLVVATPSLIQVVGNWDQAFQSIINKLPFYVPVVWMAMFASKRRSESQRLQQEYAHKEALAKSYDSYKKQIIELGEKADSLQQELLKTAILAISENASQVLDGKHGDNSPIHEMFESIIKNLKKADG